MKKNAVALITAIILILAFNCMVYADIFIDGEFVPSEQGAIIINDRTMVPIRVIVEKTGSRVEWKEAVQGVDVYSPQTDELMISMHIGSADAFLWNKNVSTGILEQTIYKLDSPPTLVDSRTYVPLRFIAERIGYTVDYDTVTKNVYLFKDGITPIKPSSDVYITMMEQDYSNGNIIEIPMFSYDGTNTELNKLNIPLKTLSSEYYAFIDNYDENSGSLEIKAYPFTSDNYAQVIVTKIQYPSYGTDGEVFSLNYDKKSQQIIDLSDALAKVGITEDKVIARVKQLYKPESPTRFFVSAEISAFRVINENEIELILIISSDDPISTEASYFYIYNTKTDKLLDKPSSNLYAANAPDKMNPPLNYSSLN